MRNVLFVSDFESFKAGEHTQVEDQIAVDAIANGYAVPSVDALATVVEVKKIKKAE